MREVLSSYCPVCIEADGIPVFEDVGGISGYIDFLYTIHHGNDDAEKRNDPQLGTLPRMDGGVLLSPGICCRRMENQTVKSQIALQT